MNQLNHVHAALAQMYELEMEIFNFKRKGFDKLELHAWPGMLEFEEWP